MCVNNTRILPRNDLVLLEKCAEKNQKVQEGLERGASLVDIIDCLVTHEQQKEKSFCVIQKRIKRLSRKYEGKIKNITWLIAEKKRSKKGSVTLGGKNYKPRSSKVQEEMAQLFEQKDAFWKARSDIKNLLS